MSENTMSVPLISVIVPVYNVEPYLDRCVESIVNQTYRNLEIILVDDGSPDRCPQMCDAWAERDARIRVIHKENEGLSDARNAGMAVASGELIGFVDSDDWIDPQMYQCLSETMEKTNSDIVSCGAKRIWVNEDHTQELCAVAEDFVLEDEYAMEALITSNGLIQTVWNKLYRRYLIENISFPVGQIYEDEFWSWKVIAGVKRAAILRDSYYNYLQRDTSIMGAGFSEKSLVVVQAKIERQIYIERSMPNLIDVGRTDLTYTCMHLGTQLIKSIRRKDTVLHLKYLRNIVRSYPVGKKYLSILPWKKRLHLRLIKDFFVPICLLHSF